MYNEISERFLVFYTSFYAIVVFLILCFIYSKTLASVLFYPNFIVCSSVLSQLLIYHIPLQFCNNIEASVNKLFETDAKVDVIEFYDKLSFILRNIGAFKIYDMVFFI